MGAICSLVLINSVPYSEFMAPRPGRKPLTQTLTFRRNLRASIDDVWAAFMTPQGVARWWWAGWADTDITMDASLGGFFTIIAEDHGLAIRGHYVEFESPTHFAFEWSWERGGAARPGERVSVTLTALKGARLPTTVLDIVHSGIHADTFDLADYRQGWEFALSSIEREVSA